MRLVCLFALILSGCSDAPPTGTFKALPLHYDYTFDIETRAATSTVDIIVEEDGDCFSLPLRAELKPSVTLNGETARVSKQADGQLQACGSGYRVGDTVTLKAAMTVEKATWEDSQVGYSEWEDIMGNPFHYMVSWVGGCDRFGPCDNAPKQFATYRFTITHPADTQVLCPGSVTATATQTICDFGFAGGPTYSTFGFAASSSWTKHDIGSWGKVKVSLFDMDGSQTNDKFAAAYHEAFFKWMQDNFGDYPYGDELRFVVGPTYWGGFEHPGNIVLSDALAGGFGSYRLGHTTNHEIVHQWAGDQTTLATTHDFVWKEAMAEYLTFVFESENRPNDATTTNRNWKTGSAGVKFYPVPGEKPAVLDFYGDVYGPGPLVLFRQLEVLGSRDQVIAAIRSLLGQERAIGVADVKAALSAELGQNLDLYFDTWVYGEGRPDWPVYTINTNVDGGAVTVTATQTNGAHPCAFSVRVLGDAGSYVDVPLSSGFDGTAALKNTVALPQNFTATGKVEFDPNHECLGFADSNVQALAPRINPFVVRHQHTH